MAAIVQMDIACTVDELLLSSTDDASIHCLTRGESVGLTLTVVTAFLSLVAVTAVFMQIIWNFWGMRNAGKRRTFLVKQPTDLYLLWLFFSDFLQSIGMIFGAKWINDGKLQEGSFCMAQGVILQLGETGVAMATLAIAMQTFCAVWWGIGMNSLVVAWVSFACMAMYLFLFVVVSVAVFGNARYESPSPFWCWIGPHYLIERIFGQYIWFWIALFVSLVAYAFLCIWSRGNITVSEEKWWKFKVHPARNTDEHDPDSGKSRSLALIAYPLVYCVVVLPLSIVRWISFVHQTADVSSMATIAVFAVYGLSGFLNVILFRFTRSELLIFTGRIAAASASGAAPLPSPSTSVKDLPMREGGAGGLGQSNAHGLGRLPEGGWDIPPFGQDDLTI